MPMVFCPVVASRPFGFFGFPFFGGDFGAELGVFFVFDRAAVFFVFGFHFEFALLAGFVFVAFFTRRGGEFGGHDGQAQRLRRGGGDEG